jgi:molybdate transport system ATP-binding protein
MLDVRVRKRLGDFELEAELEVPARSVLVLVGESGSGKSTLLRLVAGLLLPDAGRIALGNQVFVDVAAGAWLPARCRPVGYVAQDYALFPHLSVRDNVEFGLSARRTPGPERRTRVARALERLGIAELAGRHPHQLSGGQQQRVALARALVLEPEVLLLDEPLAALDQQTRRGVRAELHALLSGLPCRTVFVTHSPADALALGERIAVLEAGTITQSGTRDELLHRPRTRYVAEFLGTNLFVARTAPRDATGVVRLETGGDAILAAECDLEGEVFALVDPREITVSLEAPAGSAQNMLRGPVVELLPEPPHGDRVRVSVATRPPIVAELTRAGVERLGLRPGTPVFASFKATGVRVFR